MMDANQYKQQVNLFCEKNCTLSAQEILTVAREKQQKSEIKAVRKKMTWKRFIAVAAAAVATVGVFGVISGATGFGPMAGLFHKQATNGASHNVQQAHYDVISSELSGEGYVLYRNEIQHKDQFVVTFVGVTGDWNTPQMIFKIKCYDEEYVKTHSALNVMVYPGLNEEAYSNRIDVLLGEDGQYVGDCFYYELATAYQCADDPSMYLMTYGVYSNYVYPGATIVTEVRSIRETPESVIDYDAEDEIMLNMKYTFQLPDDLQALAKVSRLKYEFDEAPVFTGTHDVKYHLSYITFSKYITTVEMEYVYDDTDLAYIDEDFWKNYEKAELALHGTGRDMRLVVDGVTYETMEISGVYSESSGIKRGSVSFPEIDYDQAESVVLTYGDQTIQLK